MLKLVFRQAARGRSRQRQDWLYLLSAQIQLQCALPTGRLSEDGGAELFYYWPSVRHECVYWLLAVQQLATRAHQVMPTLLLFVVRQSFWVCLLLSEQNVQFHQHP